MRMLWTIVKKHDDLKMKKYISLIQCHSKAWTQSIAFIRICWICISEQFEPLKVLKYSLSVLTSEKKWLDWKQLYVSNFYVNFSKNFPNTREKKLFRCCWMTYKAVY